MEILIQGTFDPTASLSSPLRLPSLLLGAARKCVQATSREEEQLRLAQTDTNLGLVIHNS